MTDATNDAAREVEPDGVDEADLNQDERRVTVAVSPEVADGIDYPLSSAERRSLAVTAYEVVVEVFGSPST